MLPPPPFPTKYSDLAANEAGLEWEEIEDAPPPKKGPPTAKEGLRVLY